MTGHKIKFGLVHNHAIGPNFVFIFQSNQKLRHLERCWHPFNQKSKKQNKKTAYTCKCTNKT